MDSSEDDAVYKDGDDDKDEMYEDDCFILNDVYYDNVDMTEKEFNMMFDSYDESNTSFNGFE